MEDKVDKYLNFVLTELLNDTQYGFFIHLERKYVMVITPRLKQMGEDEGYIYSNREVAELTHSMGDGGVWDYKYIEDMYGLTWLEAQGVIEKYVGILARKILDQWN